MNNIDSIFTKKRTIGEFAGGYFDYLKKVLDSINSESLNKLEIELESARSEGNTIFIAGNGGSAATATTMANDIGFDIIKKTGVKKPFKFLALTDNCSVMTAIANDVGYENLFTNQLKIHYKSGDKLLVISASGNSSNLVNAAEWVKSHDGRVIGFLGFDGGKLKQLCDVMVHVQTEKGEYGPVEDAHLIINHILAHWFQCKLK
ncbi:MAG: SIS domain-containing protein [Deltaproteobacteria bacterium]|nr:MAG: SIS domain-containing protein [Deltaproteobacteria bacterium]